MGNYWDRGNRDEWRTLGRRHPKKKPADPEVAAAALDECRRLLAANDEAPPAVPRETCAEIGHDYQLSPQLLHTLECTRCHDLIEHPDRLEAHLGKK